MNDGLVFPVTLPLQETAASGDLDQLLEQPLLARKQSPGRERIDSVLVGQLVGFRDLHVPLVVFVGQPGTAALDARTTVDLRGEHIGRDVVLAFEAGDPRRPIVMGYVQKPEAWPLPERPPQVAVDADGQRLLVSAKEQMVLKCGKASITLTKAGKVLIHGSYVLSRSSGVNRVKGGSVQIN
jgi:hypothetical protein